MHHRSASQAVGARVCQLVNVLIEGILHGSGDQRVDLGQDRLAHGLLHLNSVEYNGSSSVRQFSPECS